MLGSLVREMGLSYNTLSNTYGVLSVHLFAFIFLSFFIHLHKSIHIGLCRQQLPHFLTGAPVLGIGLFLFLQQPGVLSLQLFDFG